MWFHCSFVSMEAAARPQMHQQNVSEASSHSISFTSKSEDRKRKIWNMVSARFSFHTHTHIRTNKKKMFQVCTISLTIGWKTFVKCRKEWQYWHSFSPSLSLCLLACIWLWVMSNFSVLISLGANAGSGCRYLWFCVKISGNRRLQFHMKVIKNQQSERLQFSFVAKQVYFSVS